METYLFYAYLKYSKENKQSFWPKLTTRPVLVIVFFILTLVSSICGIVFSLFQWHIATWIAITAEIIFGILFYTFSEKYHIDFCSSEYKTYKNYCLKLYDWLQEFDVNTLTGVESLCHSITAKITQLKSEEESKNARSERWLQALFIPVIIAIITTSISHHENVGEMVLSTFSIVTFFILVYGVVSTIKSISNFPQRRKIKQMECFATDLNALISIIKSN